MRELCTDASARHVAEQAGGVLSGGLSVTTVHVSSRTLAVLSELSLSGVALPALHKLVFDEEGLVAVPEVFTAAK